MKEDYLRLLMNIYNLHLHLQLLMARLGGLARLGEISPSLKKLLQKYNAFIWGASQPT